MQLHLIDWLVIGSYVAFALFVGVKFTKRASQNVDEFFLSGRTLPWWLAGTSMVATSFAADTPRYLWDPTTFACLGMLLEQAATKQYAQSPRRGRHTRLAGRHADLLGRLHRRRADPHHRRHL